ncbi:hypothetical protein CSC70_08650 [Pseudoxanthomonas kalamensis DSM 18571]|nr:hypothetical protein CSC70_08650 [Pseudoxanthomonas kalamensis DSM 18571]
MIPSDGTLLTIAHRDFAELHGISPLGLVVQGLRINCLLPVDAFCTMGVRLTYGEDWSQRLCLSKRLKAALLTMLPAASVLAPMWEPEHWQAFGDGHRHWRPMLTACPECLKSGYHSMLFQIPWVDRCPWHRVSLTTQCTTCSKPLWQSIARDTPPLLCECGHDPVSAEAMLHEPGELIERRRTSLTRYMVWALASRARRDVFGLRDDPRAWDVLGTRLLGTRLAWHESGTPNRKVLARTSTVHHPAPLPSGECHEDLARIASETSQAKDFFLELPVSVEKSMRRVSASIASKFPPDTFTERERVFLGITTGSATPAERQPRPSVILLAAYRVKDRLFFDGRILSKSVQAVLQEICLALAEQPGDQSRIGGYLRAYERILSRGYAGAAYHALSKLASPSSPSTAAFWRPVVMVRRRKQTSRLTILWLRDRPPTTDT